MRDGACAGLWWVIEPHFSLTLRPGKWRWSPVFITDGDRWVPLTNRLWTPHSLNHFWITSHAVAVTVRQCELCHLDKKAVMWAPNTAGKSEAKLQLLFFGSRADVVPSEQNVLYQMSEIYCNENLQCYANLDLWLHKPSFETEVVHTAILTSLKIMLKTRDAEQSLSITVISPSGHFSYCN